VLGNARPDACQQQLALAEDNQPASTIPGAKFLSPLNPTTPGETDHCRAQALRLHTKLVDLFEAHEVSFVAVTQQFNTTNSMGRLTLNVLLSFAQFERELASSMSTRTCQPRYWPRYSTDRPRGNAGECRCWRFSNWCKIAR
jgi:hypothetical protein